MACVVLSCLTAPACERPEPSAVPASGVPLELARHRARTISDVRYRLAFVIPDSLEQRVRGRQVVTFRRDRDAGPLVLDFAAPQGSVASIRVNGDSIAVRHESQHVIIPESALRARGTNELEIEFIADDLSLNRNRDYLYTLFVPDRARFAFPVFDQPDIKARYRLTLHVPAEWRAIANAPAVPNAPAAANAPVVADAPAGAVGNGGTRVPSDASVTHEFAQTKPIPTYLFAFAAGAWQVEQGERGGRTFRMYHRETDTAKIARNRDILFDLHAAALEWLEDYTGLPYPFEKYDFFAVPAFQYGGMEHPGAVLYRASGILLDESATIGDRLRQASVIAHETAHMWFGDLVTMEWFDDVWMKEVFANFMAAKIVNPAFPELDHELRFLLAHYPAAYEIDRTAGTHPIRQELDNLEEAGTLYGAIIYQKAPIVMRQLEALIGESAMRDGMREYLSAHAFENATWHDLIDILDRRTDDDLRAWSRVWVEQGGRPHIRTRLALDGDGRIASLRLEQSDPHGSERVWPQRLNVLLGYPDTMRVYPVEMNAGSVELNEAAGAPAPEFVQANARGLGYGLFEPDGGTLEYLVNRLPDLPDPLVRGVAWITLWDAMLEGWLSPEVLVQLALRALAVEPDPLNIERILDYLIDAYWRYLPAGDRARIAAPAEERLWDEMRRAEDTNVKAAYFNAFRSIALTESALARLRRIWREELEIPGLPLAEQDRTRLALILAVHEVHGWEGILERQARRIENPDRRDRFAVMRPAVHADPAVRDSFFAGLRDAANREHEPWVLDAVALLHHPLRAESSLSYLLPSLELLAEIQRTGDIFFPKGWLDATLAGHNSVEASEAVCEFLRSRPDYPPRLRRKILQSADPLIRASGILYDRPAVECW